jgi:hypothetical protein
MDCVSCGLFLPQGVRRCPGCGVDQDLQPAGSADARCSLHQETQATGTCSRCGRFTCVECSAVDVGVCRSCLDLVHRDVRTRLESVVVRLGWVAVVQGLIAPAIAFRAGDEKLAVLLGGAGLFSVAFGLLTVARREIWIVGPIACGFIGFFSFFALFNAPVLGLCVVLALLQWRLIARTGPLEREAWLLRKP